MMCTFKCNYCGRVYYDGPGRCTSDDCPGNGGGGSAALAIKWRALCPAANDADAFDSPAYTRYSPWFYVGLGDNV